MTSLKGLTINQIKTYNHLSFNIIYVGQVLQQLTEI
ncbi:hypothetical protein FS935_18485 [Metabacillus litoralis]|uniref:LysM domain-containing protein n=1 Tax=Metabacillus litoralis TaxID=152268 RepID=A0A5C6VLJ6_9BACI|nr:hypothetical protein FS935_18485 [Metabacillus litoralis]